MKKTTAVAPQGGEFFDPETGEQIIFTESHLARLVAIEQRIATHYIQLSLDLKEIHDGRLYLLRGNDSFSGYCQTYLHMSARHAYNHLKIATTFGEAFLKKVSKSDMPMVKLLEISRSSELAEAVNAGNADIENGRVVFADGTEEELDEFLSRSGIISKEKLTRKKLEEAKETAKSKDVLIRDYRGRIADSDRKIEELKAAIQDLVTQKDVDPERYVFITRKKEALELLDEAALHIHKIFGAIGGIPHALLDPELTGKLGNTLAGFESGLQRVREMYGAAVWLPGTNERPGDVVPD